MITLPSGRMIGEGQPPFIIAEIGSNWRTLEDCLYSIQQAKACGADAVKFQLFDEKALYGRPINFGWQNGQLDPSWLPELKTESDRMGIEFMCSAFSPELIDAVDPHVNIHKVASAECNHKRMLDRLREIGKPVFLSTGAHGPEDIGHALNALCGHNASGNRRPFPVVLLYCVAAYPARSIALDRIEGLADFGVLYGYSDHSTDVLVIPRAAAEHGACVIEKHVTFIEAETPDSPHSLNAREFSAMVRSIRGDRVAPLGFTAEEMPMVLRHNRRLIATRDVTPGDILSEGTNFGIYRSLEDDTHAFHPFMVDEVNGKISKRAIKAGIGIGPGDI